MTPARLWLLFEEARQKTYGGSMLAWKQLTRDAGVQKLKDVYLGLVRLVFGFIHVRKLASTVNTP